MKHYIKFITLLCTCIFLSVAYAQLPPLWPPMDEVILQVSAEQWVNTKTARVVVELNATLDKAGLGQIRHQMLKKLQKIAASDNWHITRFDRSQGQSGLEQLQAQAEARLPVDQLADLRDNAKSVSKSGETYTINTIDFTPSLADMETAREAVRNTLYQRINAELDRLNKTYPGQHYTVHTINTIGYQAEMARPLYKTRAMFGAAAVNAEQQQAAPANDFSISEKVRIDAFVVFGATRNVPRGGS